MDQEIPLKADLLVSSASISGALLSFDGTILDVSLAWKAYAEAHGLRARGYGVGLNYLDFCGPQDDNSCLRTYQGLKSVIARRADIFTTLYPCDTLTDRRWFLLAAFASQQRAIGSVVLHIDVSRILGNQNDPLFVNPALSDLKDAVSAAVRRAFADNSATEHGSDLSSEREDRKIISKLSERQVRILRQLATGASNEEIASALQLSPGAAKSQTAELLRNLRFKNRTQAALFAARNLDFLN